MDSGTLYYSGAAQTPVAATDLYVATLDPETGRVVPFPTALPRKHTGHMMHPAWSPDPTRPLIAFKVVPAGVDGPISVMSLQTGDERVLGTSVAHLGQFDWAPDGRTMIAVAGTAENPNVGRLVRIEVDTGTAAPLLTTSSPPDASQPRWLGGTSKIAFVRGSRVQIAELATGRERTLVDAGRPVRSFSVSPDGSMVAYITTEVVVVSVDDGRPRHVADHGDNTSAKQMTWSPDGRFLVFSNRTAQTVVPGTDVPYSELWRVPVSGGAAERMGLSADSILQPAISPDGRRLAFSVNIDPSPRVHVLDRLLPGR
jgi:Tol biopolymer transport system component